MRVLHVTPSFHPAWAYGGIPRCAYELCRGLVAAGAEVEVWTTDALDAGARVRDREAEIDGIRVRRFPNVSNSLAYHRQLYLPRGLRSHANARLREFDLLHIHSHRHALELTAARAAWRDGRPYVLTGNGTVPPIERYVATKRLLDGLGFRSVLTRADACIAVARAEVKHYLAYGVEAKRVVVIPNGIRASDYHVLPERGRLRGRFALGDAPVVLFVGKITPRKGLDVLMRAVARLPADVRLVVAGNFMMPEEPIRRLVAELGIAARVTFTGLLLDDDKLGAYVDADVVAYPSIDEIFGLVPAESLMCGTPVVVCDDSGCGELVGDAQGGLLVPYGDAGALAAALQRLLNDRDLARRCAETGRRWIAGHVDWSHIAARTIELYRELLRRR